MKGPSGYSEIKRIKFYWQVSTRRLSSSRTAKRLRAGCRIEMADVNRSSKSYRVRDVLPSARPSFLSLMLVFFCGILWLRNDTTNHRLLALENRLTLSRDIPLEKSSSVVKREETSKPMPDLAGSIEKKTQEHEKKFLDHPFVRNMTKDPARIVRPRIRRQANNTPRAITIREVRQEIIKHVAQIITTKYCQSSEKICPVGPPGLPGPAGAQGSRGKRGPKGTKGRRGTHGTMGPPGKSGPPGPRGEKGEPGALGPIGGKGQRGAPGPKGMPGPPGRPGESISVPHTQLSPKEKTREEGSNTAYYCTVGGNPSPGVEWKFKGKTLQSGAKYLVNKGELTVKNLNYSDAGQYTCVATNILGSSNASGILTVRGPPVFTKVPLPLATPQEQSTFQGTCQAKGFPAPTIRWTRLLMPLPAGKTEVNGGNLTIRKLSPADSGLYQCIATNSMGTKKVTVKLVVQQQIATTVAATECSSYTLNNETDRSVAVDQISGQCDKSLTPGWYRFNSNAGSKIPTHCVPSNKCNTVATGWLNGSHPTPQDGVVTRTVCFSFVGKCCWRQVTINVRNCGSFYVYKLVRVPFCYLRYCVTK